jgi:hypothetical protein
MPLQVQDYAAVKEIRLCTKPRRFITALKKTCHLCLIWSTWIQCTSFLPSRLRPSLISSSHLGQICPSGPILSEIPTKTESAFPSCSMHATFHTKQICLDFFIPLNLNEDFNHEFCHYGILLSLLLLISYWVHTLSSAPYSRTS